VATPFVFTLYIQNSISGTPIWTFVELYIPPACNNLSPIVQFLHIDNILRRLAVQEEQIEPITAIDPLM
jgi:hypothetical protein